MFFYGANGAFSGGFCCFCDEEDDAGFAEDPELRKRFDKGKTLKENMEQTNLKEMYKERIEDCIVVI